MAWKRMVGCLLVVAGGLVGCSEDSRPPDSPDAFVPVADAGPEEGPDGGDAGPDGGTDGGSEWDGTYVPLEEHGNRVDTGRYSPCEIFSAVRPCGTFSSFDLGVCNARSLEQEGQEGRYLLAGRMEDGSGAFRYDFAATLALGADGGAVVFNGKPATEQREGRARLFSTVQTSSDGGARGEVLVTCEAPEPPGFTGCYASCLNGRMSNQATFRAERMTWARGESEAFGLERVSERFVNLAMPADVYVTQNHAYVVGLSRDGQPGGLSVFDVSDKAAPVHVKTFQFPGDTEWNGVWAKDGALYVASAHRGVLLFDIRHPADPQFLRSLSTSNDSVHTVFVEGNRLYATDLAGVILYDVSNALEPIELNRYAPFPGINPHDMFARGDRLYVNYATEGLIAVDVSNPQDLRTLGAYSVYDHYSHASAVATFGGRTIAFMGGEGPFEHLRVLDVTDPARMVKMGMFQLRPVVSIHNMVLVGKRLYLSWYQEGVRVLDVSNPTQPQQVAYFNTFRENDPGRGNYLDGAIGIRVPGDGYIYAVDTSRGLLILREK
ncbi:hypothetical protein POL68_11460 [Stigmatella sp. ncwal1]|uniref:LVIVD repeat-containing protein n=1 Tax=Stigmatella ashevillensis TaxID=2995309 RepID=A0ABT5D5Y2_9BACT|nr:hypothetical protein [Stigmatella ashevillena]MDC0709080.1 hypothetical protein [Stigmatella ashevillena]